MHQEHLESVADHIIASYLDTGSYSRDFRDDHDSPPSLMAKVHHMRSVIQARLLGDENYELGQKYLDYGRVEFTDLRSGERYLLKSARAVAIESATEERERDLFPIVNLIRPSNIKVVVYQFRADGLELSLAPAITRGSKEKLHVADAPVVVGLWPYQSRLQDEGVPPFDQDARDTFGDLGDLGHDEDGTQGQ